MRAGEYDVFALPASSWPALMFAVCGNSVLKYSLVAVANKYVPVTVLVLTGTLVPLFTIVLSYLDPNLRQTPRWSYLGMVLVVLGLAIIVYDRARKGPTAATVLKTYGSRLQNKVE